MISVKFIGDFGSIDCKLICVPRISEIVELNLWNKDKKTWDNRRFIVLSVTHGIRQPNRYEPIDNQIIEIRLENK